MLRHAAGQVQVPREHDKILVELEKIKQQRIALFANPNLHGIAITMYIYTHGLVRITSTLRRRYLSSAALRSLGLPDTLTEHDSSSNSSDDEHETVPSESSVSAHVPMPVPTEQSMIQPMYNTVPPFINTTSMQHIQQRAVEYAGAMNMELPPMQQRMGDMTGAYMPMQPQMMGEFAPNTHFDTMLPPMRLPTEIPNTAIVDMQPRGPIRDPLWDMPFLPSYPHIGTIVPT